MVLERLDGHFAVAEVASLIAVGEAGPELPQVALPDRLTTQRTASLLAGRPTIHDDEFHVSPPNARDIDNEPIPITSVTQRAAQCRNVDGKVGRLDK